MASCEEEPCRTSLQERMIVILTSERGTDEMYCPLVVITSKWSTVGDRSGNERCRRLHDLVVLEGEGLSYESDNISETLLRNRAHPCP